MGKKEKAIDIKIDEKEPVKEVSSSEKKLRFKAIIAAYKIQNPVKYAAKREALMQKLATL